MGAAISGLDEPNTETTQQRRGIRGPNPCSQSRMCGRVSLKASAAAGLCLEVFPALPKVSMCNSKRKNHLKQSSPLLLSPRTLKSQ